MNSELGKIPPAAGAPASAPVFRFLIADDDELIQDLFKAMLKTLCRCDVDIAGNGREAFQAWSGSRYNLIFMDCQMPEMDGYQASRLIREGERTAANGAGGEPHTPIVALTGHATTVAREQCLAAGMDDYLSKPLVFEQLKDMLALYFSKSSNERALILADKNSSLPVWDKAAALKHLENDSDLLFEMIDLLLVESPKHFQSLLLFQAEGNLPELAKTAHLIKGMLDHFYAITARDCAYLLEQTALNGQPADYQSMIQTLINAVNELITQLRLTRTS